MIKIFLLLFSLAITLFSVGFLFDQDEAAAIYNDCQTNECFVNSNHGGIIKDFVKVGKQFHNSFDKMLVINGPCLSACMIMADIARPHACITKNAVFGYHKTNWQDDPPLNSDLNDWVMQHGGFPKNGNPIGIMSNSEAGRFWKRCS